MRLFSSSKNYLKRRFMSQGLGYSADSLREMVSSTKSTPKVSFSALRQSWIGPETSDGTRLFSEAVKDIPQDAIDTRISQIGRVIYITLAGALIITLACGFSLLPYGFGGILVTTLIFMAAIQNHQRSQLQNRRIMGYKESLLGLRRAQ